MITKITALVQDFKDHWLTPKEGDFVSNKELTCYCLGGMGVHGLSVLVQFMTLTSGYAIAAAYGISPVHIYIVGIITSVFNLIKAPFIGMLIDNTRSKMGKFRPYIAYCAIPTLIGYIALAYVPNFFKSNYYAMLSVFTVLFIITSTIQQLFISAFGGLTQVITPNGKERTRIMSIGAFVYSLGPSIVHALLPVLAQLFFGKAGINNLKTFQFILPVLGIITCALSYLAFTGTKERIVVHKTFVAKVKFFQGMFSTFKNKYFWIINTSTCLGALRLLSSGFVSWICLYMLNSSALIGIFALVTGTASIPGMLLAPILIRKFGKKKLIIISHIISILTSLPMVFFLEQPIVLIALTYLNLLGAGIMVVTTPAVNAEMLDYQQLKTGQRLDGFMSNYGVMLTTIVGFGSAAIVPFAQKQFGLEKDADVLRDFAILYPIMKFMIWSSVVSGLLAIIPYFFYDMTADKHKVIIDELIERARIRDEQDGLSAENSDNSTGTENSDSSMDAENTNNLTI